MNTGPREASDRSRRAPGVAMKRLACQEGLKDGLEEASDESIHAPGEASDRSRRAPGAAMKRRMRSQDGSKEAQQNR